MSGQDDGAGKERQSLAGKIALVTGGSRGVGAVTARLLAEAGADVAVNYRDKVRRAETVVDEVRAMGVRGLAVPSDITDADSVTSMMTTIADTFDRIDLLILNASGGLEKDVDPGYAMRLNCNAQIDLVEAALPLMPSGSRIVFVTSHLAHFIDQNAVMPEYEPVARSKHAGEKALRERQVEFDQRGISLVVVSGDLIDGTITLKLLNRMRPGVIDERRQRAGWLPTTEDFGAAVAKAAGDVALASGDTVYVGRSAWE